MSKRVETVRGSYCDRVLEYVMWRAFFASSLTSALVVAAASQTHAQLSTHIGEPFSDGFFASNGSGPGSNCDTASNGVERLICDDPVLAQLDLTLSASYAAARATAVEEGSAALDKLSEAQEIWQTRRDQCDGADDLTDCIAQAYEDRIQLLQIAYQQIVPGGYPVQRIVDRFRDAPKPVMEAVRSISDCTLETVGSQTMTVYDLDLGYELWAVPCWSADYNDGAALVTVAYGDPNSANPVMFERSPDDETAARGSLAAPTVDIITGQIYSFHKADEAGSCGEYLRYGWDGRETVRLLEKREQTDCNGKWRDPNQYNLVYLAW